MLMLRVVCTDQVVDSNKLSVVHNLAFESNNITKVSCLQAIMYFIITFSEGANKR